jgi:hypothetical protein
MADVEISVFQKPDIELEQSVTHMPSLRDSPTYRSYVTATNVNDHSVVHVRQHFNASVIKSLNDRSCNDKNNWDKAKLPVPVDHAKINAFASVTCVLFVRNFSPIPSIADFSECLFPDERC